MTVQTPVEFAEKIVETLAIKAEEVGDLFNIDEDKQGYFVATLYPKKFLNKEQFKMMCALVKDLGGEGYLQGAKSWMVPGPLAKKSPTPIPAAGSPLPGDLKAAGQSTAKISQSSELHISALSEDEDVKGLRGSSRKIGRLYPVLVDPSGNVIDGFHRLKADPDWPKFTVEGIQDPVQLAKARLISNERRNVSPEEKAQLLKEIIVYTNWSTAKLAEELGWAISTVYKYLPDDVKERPGVGGPSPVLRRVTQDVKPVSNETVKPQDTAVPIGEKPEPPEEPEKTHFEEEKEGWSKTEPGPTEQVQIAEFDCPECHQHLIVEHLPSGKHVIRIVREVE
jgi:hypothetical protein